MYKNFPHLEHKWEWGISFKKSIKLSLSTLSQLFFNVLKRLGLGILPQLISLESFPSAASD